MPQQIHHLLVSSIHFLFIFRKTFLLCLFLQCLIEGLKLGLGCKKTIATTQMIARFDQGPLGWVLPF